MRQIKPESSMKYVVLSILMLTAPMSFATTANDYTGSFSLESEIILHKNNQPICSESIELSAKGNDINVATMTFNATAEVNGPWIELADSTKEGQLKIAFANDQLTISLEGVLPEYLAPGKVPYNEAMTLQQAAGVRKLTVRHTFTTGVPALNADSQCIYVKN